MAVAIGNEANRAIVESGGKAKAKNMASRNVANVANVANSTYEYEYDNEYELTTTAKDNLLTTTKLCSIDRELPNLANATERYDSVGDDTWPPDCDRAEAFGCDLDDDFTEPDDPDEDSPF